MLALCAIIYIQRTIELPYGWFDAIWFWLPKARAIAHDANPLIAFQGYTFAHSDYPPLIPLLVGYGWRVFGYTPLVAYVIHGAFYVGVVALVWRSTNWWVTLITAFAISYYAASLQADLPLAFFVLAAWLAFRERHDVLTGLLLGMALLTKNEGAMLTAAALVVMTMTCRRVPLRVLLGLALPALTLVMFKTVIATKPNDVMSAGGMIDRLLDVDRWQLIAAYTANLFRSWNNAILPILLIVFVCRLRPPVAPLLAFVGLAFAGYLVIYAITPHDLYWHLSTSMDRLIIHLLPTLVVALFMSPRSSVRAKV